MERIGTVTSAWRYPVKSMAGERLTQAPVSLQGIPWDRWYAFVQADGGRSFFPWLTGREMPSILRYQPYFAPGERPRLEVRTPSGSGLPVDGAELQTELERESGRRVYLLPNYRGSFDVAAITIISNATVRRIAEASGTPVEPGRFRMNFYVETADSAPFNEDALVGRVVRIGDAVRVAVTERDKRCAMTTLAPHGGAPMTAVLAAIAKLNAAYAGVYGSVLTPGEVREGDEICVE
jgi:uncharacterized protein YcbX